MEKYGDSHFWAAFYVTESNNVSFLLEVCDAMAGNFLQMNSCHYVLPTHDENRSIHKCGQTAITTFLSSKGSTHRAYVTLNRTVKFSSEVIWGRRGDSPALDFTWTVSLHWHFLETQRAIRISYISANFQTISLRKVHEVKRKNSKQVSPETDNLWIMLFGEKKSEDWIKFLVMLHLNINFRHKWDIRFEYRAIKLMWILM